MKKTILYLMIVVCILTLGAGNAFAYNTLQQFLNDQPQISYKAQVADDASMIPVKGNGDENLQASIRVDGQYTSMQKPWPTNWGVGWYYVSGSTTSPLYVNIQEVLDSNVLGHNNPFNQIGTPFKVTGPFAVFLTNGLLANNPSVWTSQAKFNADGKAHAQAWEVTQASERRWYIGFDTNLDDNARALSGDPNAYAFTDLIVYIQPVATAPIPEFPTIALPMAAILGILFIVGRKRGDI